LGQSAGSAQDPGSEAPPGWINKLCIGLAIYVVVCASWMVTGVGGERVTH
jgi:hypothetical protein